jgi:hypothetical protein
MNFYYSKVNFKFLFSLKISKIQPLLVLNKEIKLEYYYLVLNTYLNFTS